jgi:hypothetical protein
MNDEFKRLQELAGIKEMKVGNPIPVKFNDLKIGDKLRTVKNVYNNIGYGGITLEPGDNDPFTMVGDVWKVQGTGPFIQMVCIQGVMEGHILGGSTVKKLIDMEVFRRENR